jgi:hypothetical protein
MRRAGAAAGAGGAAGHDGQRDGRRRRRRQGQPSLTSQPRRRRQPTDKAPWLRMAQMRFEDKNYGEAIVSGLAVIERDPDDMLAYSLVAVSGLRVSSKALGDLTQKNGFSGSVKSEAQDLANLLHGTLKVEKKPAKPAAVAAFRAAPTRKSCNGIRSAS